MVNRSTISHKEDLLPLSSGQHWYLNVWQPVNPHYRNLVSLLSVPPTLDPILLKRTLQYLLQYHDALRLRFVQGELGWYQYLLQSDDNIPFTYINLTAVSVDQREKILEELASEQQASLNLFLGPIFKLVYFDFGKSTHGRLLFIIHHLITDALSQTIFLHDFRTAYLQLYSGKEIHLPSKTASFTTWAKRLDAYAQSGELKGEIDNYWLILPWNKVVSLPVDYPGNIQSCTMSSNRLIQTALNVEETIDLLKHSLSARLPMQVGLLAGLALTFADWTGSPLLQVGVMNHGRTLLHDLKLTRTMGFIALAGELLLDIRDTHTLYDVLSRVKEQLQGVPNYGFGYELLTRLCRDTEANKKMHIIPPRQLLFNYMGHKKDTSTQSDFFQSAHENTGPNIDPQEKRKNVDLYCKVIIIDNQLCVTWEYSKDVHRSSTIEAVAQNYLATLRKIAGFLARM